ncbi:MAG: substrate-binding domain-containing protein [Alphaproteobacteria bacterium]|nr:substrate-binding domain-containing protein [Alphaproteobacteria bacterium]
MARDEIRIVGSSTVYPFSTKVAQEFEAKTGIKVVVESTGSGGGHKLFCAGVGTAHPDITNSSRRQKKSELETCAKNGVTDVVEVKVGFDGIVIANARSAPDLELSLEEVYRAFAQDIPAGDGSGDKCQFVPNPNTKWTDIRADLPDVKIEAYGPPPTSGTRDAFVEIAMEGGAEKVPCMKALKSADSKAFEAAARTLREDGAWIDAGENDSAIVQTLVRTPSAVGVFGFSFLDQNADKIKGATIDGVDPEFESIASGDYPVSRSLYFYIKKQHVGVVPGIQEYAVEFMSDGAAGPDGYLPPIGLIPLPPAELEQYQDVVKNMTTYSQ